MSAAAARPYGGDVAGDGKPICREDAATRDVEEPGIVPQPKLHWSAYLWPGLPHLWVRGSWVGLALAVGFTALVNVLLATSLVWREWLPVRGRWIGLASLAVVWLLAWAEARADWRRWLAQWSAEGGQLSGPERSDQWLADAQQSYLAGDWVVAEQTLRQLLRWEPRDVEALLMLATMWRHQRRWPEAEQYLGQLERLEAATYWEYEIAQERQLLRFARENSQQGVPEEAPSDVDDASVNGAPASNDKPTSFSGPTNSGPTNTEISDQHDAREERNHTTAEEPAWKRAA